MVGRFFLRKCINIHKTLLIISHFVILSNCHFLYLYHVGQLYPRGEGNAEGTQGVCNKPTLNPDLVPAPSQSGQKEVRIGSEGQTEAGT